MNPEMAVCGGKSETKAVDSESRQFLNTVKRSVESQTGKKYAQWQPNAVRTQIVAGVNYFAKIKVGDNEYIHVTVWKKLGDEGYEITSVSPAKADDPL